MTKKLLQTTTSIQATAMALDNAKFLKKKNKNSSDFIKQTTKNVVGVSMLSVAADIIDNL